MERIRRGSAVKLFVTYTVDGVATNTDGDTPPTVTVLRGDGTQLFSGAATNETPTGQYSYTLAAQATVESLTLTWVGTIGGLQQTAVTYAEVVGDFYFTIGELLAQDGCSAFSASKCAEVRAETEDLFEQATGVAWVPRYGFRRLDGNERSTVVLPAWPLRALVSAKADGATVDTALLKAYEDGRVTYEDDAYTWPCGDLNVAIAYEHGYPHPPSDLRAAALTYARYRLLSGNSRIPDRATLMTTDFGTFSLSTAGAEKPTGMPEVDAVLAKHDKRLPGMA